MIYNQYFTYAEKAYFAEQQTNAVIKVPEGEPVNLNTIDPDEFASGMYKGLLGNYLYE